MKQVILKGLKKELKEIWFFVKLWFMLSGVLFWVLIILSKTVGGE